MIFRSFFNLFIGLIIMGLIGGCVTSPSSDALTTFNPSGISPSADDTIQVNFTSATQTVAEGNTPITTLTISLSQTRTFNVSIPIFIGGTATAGNTDHDCANNTLTITAGNLSTTLDCNLVTDTLDEENETITFTINNIGLTSGIAVGSLSLHTVTITDDDAAPDVDWNQGAASAAAEGTGANTTFTLTAELTAVSGRIVSVPFTVSGTATANTDHNCGSSVITIPAGSLTASSSNCLLLGDSKDEPNETIIFTIGAVTNATANGDTVHTRTITDDDATPTVNFSSATQVITEGNMGNTNVIITASLSAVSGRTVTIPLTFADTETTATVDHNCANNSLTLVEGEGSASYTCQVIGDTSIEGHERFTVTFAGALTNANDGAIATQTIFVDDDDGHVSVDWTWVAGANTDNIDGVYGIRNVPAATTLPGSRVGHSMAMDSLGNLWLFAGHGRDELSGVDNYLNCLWKFDISINQWIWVSGSKTANVTGLYGTINNSSAANYPGARRDTILQIDTNDHLWIFGGYGRDGAGTLGFLNDVWKFNPNNQEWTYVKGASVVSANAATYGTKGTAAVANTPAGRRNMLSWIDATNQIWMFGGYNSANEFFSDLWKFNTTLLRWTWVHGPNTVDEDGVYGTQGTGAVANNPGARHSTTGWIDSSGDLFLFGGFGYDEISGVADELNDLWQYDVSGDTWAWVTGAKTSGEANTVTTIGTLNPSDRPGARYRASSWIDSDGHYYIFGGVGIDSAVTTGNLNDLWKFDTDVNQWVLVSGASTISNAGNYGALGATSYLYYPPQRFGATGVFSNQIFWLFGGENATGKRQELWKFIPH
jgi:N-acetylneuraminic acid mutarotase